jgi:hypothetical protein
LPKYPIQLTREHEGHLQPRSTCYTAPFAEVQRARLHLLAHPQPPWRHAAIARQVGCWVTTVKHGRQRWPQTDSGRAAPRAGTRRPFTPLQRAPITALAWSAPRTHGKPGPRWAGEQLAQVAVAQQLVEHSSPGTIRPWLRAAKSTPWR